MSRVAEPLQCSGCGANLKPKEDGSGLWKCEFCGKPHVVDMLGNIYAIEIKGSVEVFQGNAEKERLAKNADNFLQLAEWKLAKEELWTLTRNYPDDYRGWLGLYKIPFVIYFSGGDFSPPEFKNFENALRLNREEALHFFDYLIKEYGEDLRLQHSDKKVRDLSFNGYLQKDTIDAFTQWLLFKALKSYLEIEYVPLTTFLYRLSKNYFDSFMDGKILPASTEEIPVNINAPDWCYVNNQEYYLLQGIFKYFGCRVVLSQSDYIVFSPIEKGKSITLYRNISYYAFKLMGKWLEYCGELFLLPYTPQLTDIRKAAGVCPNCGAIFSGLLHKRCTNPKCRLPKDY